MIIITIIVKFLSRVPSRSYSFFLVYRKRIRDVTLAFSFNFIKCFLDKVLLAIKINRGIKSAYVESLSFAGAGGKCEGVRSKRRRSTNSIRVICVSLR